MIQLSQITKVVTNGGAPTTILRSVDLRIAAGEFISIIGPSGSGKSTLMNIIGLLDDATSGEYLFGKKNVQKLSSSQRAAFLNQKIGFVFQSFMLIPRLTVKENVEVPLLYQTLSRREREERILHSLEQVGMLHKMKEPIFKLSGGQKQKVAIARAIVNEPDVLLADEPTGNLDQQSKMEILGIFGELHQRGKTILLVTHDLEIAEMADRTLTMKNGEWVNSSILKKVGSLR